MEENEEKKENQKSRVKRSVSLFKKRKKAEIRSFVKETRYKQYKRTLVKLLFITIILFSIVGVLWGLRFFIIPYIFESDNSQIIKPTSKNLNATQIKEEIESSGLFVEEIEVSSDLTQASFKVQKDTQVILDPRRNLKQDFVILKAIMNEMIEGNKKAIYIDLRYNKPIVKF